LASSYTLQPGLPWQSFRSHKNLVLDLGSRQGGSRETSSDPNKVNPTTQNHSDPMGNQSWKDQVGVICGTGKGPRNNQDQIVDEIWKGALKAAKEVERELGKGNVGQWDDFEWGMINGKLSAIRWVLGDD
jgi:hypothetical protein